MSNEDGKQAPKPSTKTLLDFINTDSGLGDHLAASRVSDRQHEPVVQMDPSELKFQK